MYISHLQLRNFMCHHELDLDFGSGVNYLVGDNNSGKTTVLRALQYLHDGVTKGHDISEYRYHALGASNEEVDTVPVVVTADIVFERSEVPPQCLADDDPEYNSKADGHLLNDAVYDPLCPYVFFDNNTKQYLLRVRRSSATVTLHKHSKGKASTLGIKDIGVFDNRNKREDEYTNATGISAKIQRLLTLFLFGLMTLLMQLQISLQLKSWESLSQRKRQSLRNPYFGKISLTRIKKHSSLVVMNRIWVAMNRICKLILSLVYRKS